MHEAACHSPETGKRLEPVAGNSERQRHGASDATLAQAQEFLDIQVPRRRAVQLAQGLCHRGTDIALDQDIRSRADGRK